LSATGKFSSRAFARIDSSVGVTAGLDGRGGAPASVLLLTGVAPRLTRRYLALRTPDLAHRFIKATAHLTTEWSRVTPTAYQG
jgi:hypothetical protein